MDAGQQAAEQVPAEEPLHLPLPRLTPRQLCHVPAGARQVHHEQHLDARLDREPLLQPHLDQGHHRAHRRRVGPHTTALVSIACPFWHGSVNELLLG